MNSASTPSVINLICTTTVYMVNSRKKKKFYNVKQKNGNIY